MENKVILIDGSVLSFRSIFNWGQLTLKKIEGKIPEDQFIMPSHYTYLSMIISVLKKIMVSKNDKIILAMDGLRSWRRLFYSPYKNQRKEQRDKHDHIDWMEHWNKIEEVNNALHKYTQINVVKLNDVLSYEDLINSEEGIKFLEPNSELFGKTWGIEGDDLIAYACKYFSNQKCVVVTIDKDLYQLKYFDNVEIFSMNLKTPKGKNGAYVINCDPLKILNDKCRLGDVSDNIIINKENPDEDAEIRRFIIDVLNFPSFLDKPIKNVLDNLDYNKENYIENLPFYSTKKKTLAHRFLEIYTDKNYVSYEYCKKLHEKKEAEKKEKAKEKREMKKAGK